MIKGILHFFIFSVILFGVHQFAVLPNFGVSDTVPVIFQHLLLGGFSIIIYAVTYFVSKNFFNYTGYAVLGFLFLKMIFLGIFITVIYELEISAEPKVKYILLGLYFIYLVFLLLKIVPLINVDFVKKTDEKS